LKYVNRTKSNKYRGLIHRLEKEVERLSDNEIIFQVDFRTIIVSSLEAIPNSTILNLSVIIGNKSKVIMNL
jgi:hypothetical protein